MSQKFAIHKSTDFVDDLVDRWAHSPGVTIEVDDDWVVFNVEEYLIDEFTSAGIPEKKRSLLYRILRKLKGMFG